MGRYIGKQLKPFTEQHVKDRELVIKMLKFETDYAKSEKGQMMYKNPLNFPGTSLTVEYAFNRVTLTEFGFETDDTDVENYRSIFRTYFKSPTDYDKEVIEASYYMKNNKCVFYEKAPMLLGQKIPNCDLYYLNGETKTTLYDTIINNDGTVPTYSIFAAFSLS